MKIDYSQYPDKNGHFGIYGGKFAPETLMAALEELNEQYESVKNSAEFLQELNEDLINYV
ncbi:MAG TPA: tryptophan synthase subunit beta, partial [Thiomicrospira sp.]|nr:tryptophan synthase subunit beta [Thiomicrospira sp.]